MDPRKMLQMKSALDQLNKNHPKLWPFIQSLEQEGLEGGGDAESRDAGAAEDVERREAVVGAECEWADAGDLVEDEGVERRGEDGRVWDDRLGEVEVRQVGQ